MRFSGRTLCSILSAILLLSAANVTAQTTEPSSASDAAPTFKASHLISLWSTDGKNLSPSYFYAGKKVSAEARYNWDDDKVGAACIGKPIGKDSFMLIPEACGYVGKWNGYGPELWILSETRRLSIVSYVQYAKLVDANQRGYSWLQSEAKVSRWFGLGIGGQALKNGGSPLAIDLGPSIKLSLKSVDLSIMPMWRATSQGRGERVVFAGVGYVL